MDWGQILIAKREGVSNEMGQAETRKRGEGSEKRECANDSGEDLYWKRPGGREGLFRKKEEELAWRIYMLIYHVQ